MGSPSTALSVVDVTDDSGKVVAPEWLARAEDVHRQLRPHLPQAYAEKMERVFAQGGRMAVAVSGGAVVGVAVHRTYENTFDGMHLYVDDLVTDDRQRSTGVGHALMEHLRAHARRQKCLSLTLDSGMQRQRAHRFYFREGMFATSLHFAQTL